MFGCEGKPIDITIEDAFKLMNEAIQTYLEADSIELNYQGTYTSTLNNLTDDVHVRIKRMGLQSMVGIAEISVHANNDAYLIINNYQDNILYTRRIEGTESSKLYESYETSTYKSLFTSFLKTSIKWDDTRDHLLQTTSSEITLTFDLASAVIGSTLYVLPAMNSARLAKVTFVFTPRAVLKTMSATYEASIQDTYGAFNYQVDFVKINRYVIVPTLSSSEKSGYQEKTQDEA
jgi:hypothetical protein